MIKYKLICNNCDLSFDSWFASSNEYEKLKKKSLLTCHNCNSSKVEKTLMAPKLISKKSNIISDLETKKIKSIKKTINKYQKFIKKNFDYVGANFANEARSIHYSTKKKKKSIYGTASNSELKDLREEGIDTQIIPWVDDKKN